MELIFLITSLILLCFALAARMTLITHECFAYCSGVLAQHQGCLFNSLERLVGWGWVITWEGTQLGQLTKTHQSDIPYRLTHAQQLKPGEKRSRVGICY